MSPMELPAAMNLNDAVTSGNYFQPDGSADTAKNYPKSGSGGLLEVFVSGTQIVQRFHTRGGWNTLYSRTASSGSWQAWKTFTSA